MTTLGVVRARQVEAALLGFDEYARIGPPTEAQLIHDRGMTVDEFDRALRSEPPTPFMDRPDALATPDPPHQDRDVRCATTGHPHEAATHVPAPGHVCRLPVHRGRGFVRSYPPGVSGGGSCFTESDLDNGGVTHPLSEAAT